MGKDRRKPRSLARPHGHAKEALRASEERYGSVVAALAEGIVFMDADGRLQASNASAERILGLTAEQIGWPVRRDTVIGWVSPGNGEPSS